MAPPIDSDGEEEDAWDAPAAPLLANLAWLTRRTGAQIVVSSTWRLDAAHFGPSDAAFLDRPNWCWCWRWCWY